MFITLARPACTELGVANQTGIPSVPKLSIFVLPRVLDRPPLSSLHSAVRVNGLLRTGRPMSRVGHTQCLGFGMLLKCLRGCINEARTLLVASYV